MSDFAITAPQRKQLLAGDLSPLDFETKPFGCDPGARYVLVWSRATAVLCDDGHVIPIPRQPVLWLTVTRVDRVLRRGTARWRVRFDVTDLRDDDEYLRAGGGYTSSRWRAVDPLPVAKWTPQMLKQADAVSEFWHQRRLARFAEEQRLRRRERSKAHRKKAA